MVNDKIRKIDGPCQRCVADAIRAGRPAKEGKSELVLQGDKLRCLRCNALFDLASVATDFANALAKTASEQMRLQIVVGVKAPIEWSYHHGYDSTIFLVDLLHAAAQALSEKALREPGTVTH